MGVEAIGANGKMQAVPFDRAHGSKDDGCAKLRLEDLVDRHQLVLDLGHASAPGLDARNIRVSTSMSTRACSGGVRQGVPSTTQLWKWTSSREKASSYDSAILTAFRGPVASLRR